MSDHRLTLFLGKPLKFTETISVHSPTIDEIDDSGIYYNIHLFFATFDAVSIHTKFLEGVTDEEIEELEKSDHYSVLLNHSTPIEFINTFCDAISFFTKSNITYRNHTFYSNELPFLNKENYKSFVNLIRKANCIEKEKEEKPNFKNDRVKEKYKKMQELKKKYNMSQALDLKDICSILCNAEGNGIDIFNVKKLTIYQVYEQFERLGIKENYLKTLMLWANTYTLSENGKLQEWMVKSKI